MTDPEEQAAIERLKAWATAQGGAIPRPIVVAIGEIWMVYDWGFEHGRVTRTGKHPGLVVPPGSSATGVPMFEASSHHDFPPPRYPVGPTDTVPSAGYPRQERGLRSGTMLNLGRTYTVPPNALIYRMATLAPTILDAALETRRQALEAARPRLPPPDVS